MKKVVLTIIMAILLVSTALAISLTRNLPDNIDVGENFDLDLTVHDSIGNYGVLYIIDILGGCTSASGKTHLAGGFIDDVDKTTTLTMIAPDEEGICSFTGDYQFADASGIYDEVVFDQKDIIINEEEEEPEEENSARDFCRSIDILDRESKSNCYNADWNDNEGELPLDCMVVDNFNLETYSNCIDEGGNWFSCYIKSKEYLCIELNAD